MPKKLKGSIRVKNRKRKLGGKSKKPKFGGRTYRQRKSGKKRRPALLPGVTPTSLALPLKYVLSKFAQAEVEEPKDVQPTW
jgi:hypothetical protein